MQFGCRVSSSVVANKPTKTMARIGGGIGTLEFQKLFRSKEKIWGPHSLRARQSCVEGRPHGVPTWSIFCRNHKYGAFLILAISCLQAHKLSHQSAVNTFAYLIRAGAHCAFPIASTTLFGGYWWTNEEWMWVQWGKNLVGEKIISLLSRVKWMCG